MRIDAVTVCIGYGDFLRETARFNDPIINKWVVATVDRDHETLEVCRKHSIEVLRVADYPNADGFNKGRIIERALRMLPRDGWRLHLDADIALPREFKNIIASAELDHHKIYGADRIMVKSYEAWCGLQKHWMTHSYHNLVKPPPGFSIGSRWADHEIGYVPIGFFQMWHSHSEYYKGTRSRPYPTEHNDACRTDVQFGMKWDRRHRELLPEFFVVHLESQEAPNGANWCGRKTRRFGPPCTPQGRPYGDC